MSGNYRNCHMRFIFGLVPWCCSCWSWYAISLLLIDPDPKTLKTPAKSTQWNTHKNNETKQKKQTAPA